MIFHVGEEDLGLSLAETYDFAVAPTMLLSREELDEALFKLADRRPINGPRTCWQPTPLSRATRRGGATGRAACPSAR
jgi:hypothetical protein